MEKGYSEACGVDSLEECVDTTLRLRQFLTHLTQPDYSLVVGVGWRTEVLR